MRLYLRVVLLAFGTLVFEMQVIVAGQEETETETEAEIVLIESVPEHLKGMTRVSFQPAELTVAASAICGTVGPRGKVITVGPGGIVFIKGKPKDIVGDVANSVRIANPARNDGPHDSATAVVHANDVALNYRRKNFKSHDYPVGSVFLKEKFISGDADKLRLATVMERLEDEGTIDDWQFSIIMFPGGAKEILRGNTAAACADCHSGFEKRGFLSQHSESSLAKLLITEQKAKASGDAGERK